eukprot:GHVT01019090.1.p1 GENE.GHVT01019090.1~~GHVT01019090.1.p1  ORF type:complete len:291 (+),score=19.78 GHVT01019090.1:118-990(+)
MSEPEQRQWGYSFEGATNLGPCVEEEAGTPEEGVECAEGGGIPIESGEAATSSNGNQETLPNSPDILNGLLNWFWQNFPGQPVTLTEENGRYVLLLQQPPLEATILESPKELPTGQIPVPIPSTLTQNIVAGADQLVAKELGTGSGPSCPSDNQGALTPQTNAHYEHQVPFQSTLIEQLLVKRKVNARTLLTGNVSCKYVAAQPNVLQILNESCEVLISLWGNLNSHDLTSPNCTPANVDSASLLFCQLQMIANVLVYCFSQMASLIVLSQATTANAHLVPNQRLHFWIS